MAKSDGARGAPLRCYSQMGYRHRARSDRGEGRRRYCDEQGRRRLDLAETATLTCPRYTAPRQRGDTLQV